MLRVLQHVPFLGVRLENTLGGVYYQKLVTVRRRRWTLHILYRIDHDNLLIEYVDPVWVRRQASRP